MSDDEATTGPQVSDDGAHAVPGQPPGTPVQPVPAPGAAPGVSAPAVHASQGPAPEDGVHAAEKTPGSDASISSPGAWSSLAVPGKPDGEVDTRSR
jgi:hypothetical protein